MSARILVVEHQENCSAGLVGRWLVDAGARLEVVRPYRGAVVPQPATYDALLVLGGDMGADDDATVPWLGPLKAHLRDAVAAGVPVLGICLGHQLVAAALGGVVRQSPGGPALGVVPVVWEGAAADDPLFSGVTAAEGVVHWNADVGVTPPRGSTVLATSGDGSVEAARFAPAAWGIQAHPEVDAAVCRQWAEVDREDHLERRVDQEALLATIEGAEAELQRQWRPLGERFAELATARRAGSAR